MTLVLPSDIFSGDLTCLQERVDYINSAFTSISGMGNVIK